jgi:hypothetical protein
MKKPSANKVIATFGVLFIAIITYALPAIIYVYLLENNLPLAKSLIFILVFYYFEIKTFADWIAKKYKEIQ